MDITTSRYFRINKFFLSVVGLWPYQTWNLKYLSLSFTSLGLIMILLPQVTYFVKHSNNVDKVFAVMPIMTGTCMTFMKFICLVYSSEKFKVLLQLTQEDWSCLLKSEETQIISRYVGTARKFTIMYSCCMFMVVNCYTLLPFMTSVLDIILPLNETRPRKVSYPADFFVNEEKYYYIIVLSEYIGLTICGIITTAIDSTYFFILEHVCGMQTVLCYRLENLKMYDKLKWVSNKHSHRSDKIKNNVRQCIELDKRIRIYLDKMESVFETVLLIDIVLGVVVNTSICIMIVLRADRLSEIIGFIAIFVQQTLRLFLISWTGQEVTNHSSDIPIAAYNAMWYLMPTEVQKMVMLLIARSQSPSQMILAGIYIISLENFSSIMKTTISYCMVMISLR